MGWNSGVLILNDAFHDIDENLQEWWDQVRLQIQGGSLSSLKAQTPIKAGNHYNSSYVFHCEHMDTVGVYAIGGNEATLLGFTRDPREGFHTYDAKLKLLKDLAEQFDYRLVPKRQVD